VEPVEITDPYDSCEHGRCNHDLGRAVGVAELWGSDGPYPGGPVVLRLRASALFDDEEESVPDLVADQQRWAV